LHQIPELLHLQQLKPLQLLENFRCKILNQKYKNFDYAWIFRSPNSVQNLDYFWSNTLFFDGGFMCQGEEAGVSESIAETGNF
jgi:hypothetical protein